MSPNNHPKKKQPQAKPSAIMDERRRRADETSQAAVFEAAADGAAAADCAADESAAGAADGMANSTAGALDGSAQSGAGEIDSGKVKALEDRDREESTETSLIGQELVPLHGQQKGIQNVEEEFVEKNANSDQFQTPAVQRSVGSPDQLQLQNTPFQHANDV